MEQDKMDTDNKAMNAREVFDSFVSITNSFSKTMTPLIDILTNGIVLTNNELYELRKENKKLKDEIERLKAV